jgi:putative transposase
MHFQNKKRRKEFYHYSTPGLYFVTICTKERQQFFCKVINNIIHLSMEGNVVLNCWLDIVCHYDFVKLHEFIVMPDHIHGIVELEYSPVGADHDRRLRRKIYQYENVNPHYSRPNQKLPKIIGSFKSASTNKIRNSNPQFAWQRSYHDRIIRNQNEYFRIANYIKNNPYNWK